ncbi:MAG: hypothetical protein KC435_13350 [Thermomicrobiales bacterium]|nr:hypothetical protein [Thermomicrobiales bacterium]
MKRLALVQIGHGTVGGDVIRQVVAQRAQWQEAFDLDVRIAAVAGRHGVVLIEDGGELSEGDLLNACERRGMSATGPALTEVVPAVGNADAVILMDASAGESATDALVAALDAGAGAVLSNKAPMALPLSDPRAVTLWDHARSGERLKYEATCGAGLPVISTLQTLLNTGDDVIEITAAASGTFGAIFSSVARGVPFSIAVADAKAAGYTEPDPRDDLSGLDVARKALILSRTMGRRVDLDEIEVESLVPESLADVSIETFMAGLGISNAEIGAQAAKAISERASLKYVATVTPDGDIAVGLRAVPLSTVLGALQGPENIFSFRTRRYDAYPTVVSGPGAGAAVTAAGMIGDALNLARDMVK